MSAAEKGRLRLAAPGIFALEQLEQVDREIAVLPRHCGCCGDEDTDGSLLRREAVQEVVARAIEALIMEGTPAQQSPGNSPAINNAPAAPLCTPGVTVPVRIEVQKHGDHGRWGWRWRVLVMGGAGAARRPLVEVAQGVAPDQGFAEQRAFRAWETFSADYPGHYELEIPGG